MPEQIDASISNHMLELPDLTHAVKVLPVESASKEALVDAWKQWVEQSGALHGRGAFRVLGNSGWGEPVS